MEGVSQMEVVSRRLGGQQKDRLGMEGVVMNVMNVMKRKICVDLEDYLRYCLYG